MHKTGAESWTWVRRSEQGQSDFLFTIPPKKAITAVFIAAILLCALVTGVVNDLLQARELQHNEALLHSQIKLQQNIIQGLQTDLNALDQQSAALHSRMEQVCKMEQQLKAMLPASSGAVIPMPASSSPGKQAAANTSERLAQVTEMADRSSRDMALLLEEAGRIKEKLDTTPTYWPSESIRITSAFGERSDPFHGAQTLHNGLDIAGSTGDPIMAAADGTVADSGYHYAMGNYIIIRHKHNLTTRYLHLSEILVEPGQAVGRGEEIGFMGSTGRSTGPHLHFEIRQGDIAIDPQTMLILPQ